MDASPASSLIDILPLRQRLALAYGARSGRARIGAVLALDAPLAGILRHSREPMLAQLRFAWWREMLASDPARWPAGEPLLAAISTSHADPAPLAGLVDGWEAMTGAAPLGEDAFATLAAARAGALAGNHDEGQRLARGWALADIARHLSHPQEREAALGLAQAADWRAARLPRSLRPLAVLHALAARDLRKGLNEDRISPAGLLVAMRVGLTGW
ncbi:MAG TPA: hypothetical protein PKD92_12610 [Novosphingobium sp.]|nr:hypothetical protein [Novosphingobium sp.]